MVEMSKAEEIMQSYKKLNPIEQATVEGVLLGILTVKKQEKEKTKPKNGKKAS